MTGGAAPAHRSGVQRFAYHRSLTPMLGMLLGLALVETFGVHIFAMAYWGRTVALVLGAVDLSLLVFLVSLLRSFRTCPITLGDGVLTLRTGHRLRIAIPLETIAGFRTQWSAADLKAPGMLNMALIAWPNIVIELRAPVMRRRKAVTAIAHCVDDVAALRAALEAPLPLGERDL